MSPSVDWPSFCLGATCVAWAVLGLSFLPLRRRGRHR